MQEWQKRPAMWRRRPDGDRTGNSEKGLLDSDGQAHRLYSELAEAHREHKLEPFQAVIRELHMLVLNYDFEPDSVFVDSGIGSILFDSAFDRDLPLEDADFALATLQEFFAKPTCADLFLNMGVLEKLLGSMENHTDRSLRLLAFLAWNKPDVARRIMESVRAPESIVQLLISVKDSEDRDFLVTRARSVLYCLYALSVSVPPEQVGEWCSAIELMFDCNLLEPRELAYLIPTARNLCTTVEAASNLSAVQPFVTLVNRFVSCEDKEEVGEIDRLDTIRFLSRVLRICRGAPDVDFLRNFAMPTVKSLFTSGSESDSVMKKAAKCIYEAAQVPLLQPQIAATEFLKFIADTIDELAFTTKKYLVLAATMLVRDAPNDILASLIDANITHLLTSGFSLADDQSLLTPVLHSLIKLLRTNRDRIAADLRDDTLPFLQSVLADPASITEENDVLLREFLTALD